MALAIDASTPAITSSTSNPSSLASNSFAPPANSLLLLVVAGASDAGSSHVVTGVANTGTALTWNKLKSQKGTGGDTVQDMWYAYTTPSHASMTVTPSFSGNNNVVMVGVIVLTGAASTQAGATNNSTSYARTPSISVTGTASGSWVFAVATIFDTNAAPTAAGGQTISFNGNSFRAAGAIRGSVWAQAHSVPDSGGTITINDTAPTFIEYGMIAVEIQAEQAVWGTSATLSPWMVA